ncbi:MAG: hypothetical protein WAS54_03525 [Scrofimicrobium sp.]
MTTEEQTGSEMPSENLDESVSKRFPTIQAETELHERIEQLEAELATANETIRRLRDLMSVFDKERQTILTVRDYAIGMEQSLGQARFELDQRNDIDHELRTEIIETHARLAASIEDAQAAYKRLSRTPYGKLRRAVGNTLRKAGLR